MVNTTPSRYPSRSTGERDLLYEVIDGGLYCTVAFVKEGVAHQIPTGFCRVDNELFIHASSKSGFIDAIIGHQVSFSITHLDALVLAPTAFDHSFNYRSAIGYSIAEEITDPNKKLRFFNLFTDRYIPGRIADIGEPTQEQLSITKIVRLSLENAATKVREGDVNVKLVDDNSWCGIIPLVCKYGEPVKDQQLSNGVQTPMYIKELVDGHRSS